MYIHDICIDDRLNRDIATGLVKNLREQNASRYGLPNRVPYSPLIKGTSLYERKGVIGYNLGQSLTEENTVLFTGQCLVKDEEDSECPITLEDAIECERLKELLQLHPIPAICMYPDSTYAEFVEGWSGKNINKKLVNDTTEKYLIFRRKILPQVRHYRTSELEERLQMDVSHLESQVRRIYGGRVLKDSQKSQLQRSILQYGIKTILLPSIVGYGDRDIVVFAEPDEICSVKAATLVRDELGLTKQIGLIGQIPVPSLEFPLRGKIRMYSAGRKERIHLNEPDARIETKLRSNFNFSLLVLVLSPLTTKEQLEEVMKSRDRRASIPLVMEQIQSFRRYLE